MWRGGHSGWISWTFPPFGIFTCQKEGALWFDCCHWSCSCSYGILNRRRVTCLSFGSACDSTLLFCCRPKWKHAVVSNQLCRFISTWRCHSVHLGLLGQRQEEVRALIRLPFAEAEEMSWSVRLLRVEAVWLGNCLRLLWQMILLSSILQ